MGIYLNARMKEEFEGRVIWGFAPMYLFDGLDKNMFCPEDQPIIRFNDTTLKLFNRLNINHEIEEMSLDISNGDLFRLYKETTRILNTWSPNMNKEQDRILLTHIKWLNSFINVCLENELRVGLG